MTIVSYIDLCQLDARSESYQATTHNGHFTLIPRQSGLAEPLRSGGFVCASCPEAPSHKIAATFHRGHLFFSDQFVESKFSYFSRSGLVNFQYLLIFFAIIVEIVDGSTLFLTKNSIWVAIIRSFVAAIYFVLDPITAVDYVSTFLAISAKFRWREAWAESISIGRTSLIWPTGVIFSMIITTERTMIPIGVLEISMRALIFKSYRELQKLFCNDDIVLFLISDFFLYRTSSYIGLFRPRTK